MDLSTERSSSIVRWTLCGIGSVALHFALLSGTRTPGVDRVTFGGSASSIEVRMAMAPNAEIQRTESTTQWQPLPRWAVDRPRFAPYPSLLPFRSVDLELHSVDESAYLPVSRLTLRPTPVEGIFVPYPEAARHSGHMRARLVLLIDEDGTVVKVTSNDPHLPAIFAESAISAFARARFHPGRIAETAVKTRMVVDVEFEERAS
jgi:TonB family protein